ncbi:MAG: carboxypeptidase regulatory-like domain-containing protein [Planctomycetota bacterium]|nr:carboxypeptidase regulatory-like domain-containing protein [Planctomycetota bacterium]
MLLDCGKSLYFRLSGGFSIPVILLAATALILSGCGGKKHIPVTAKLKGQEGHLESGDDGSGTEEATTKVPVVVSFDADNLGSVKGRVVLSGTPEPNLEIGMGGDCSNHPSHAGKAPLSDRVLVGEGGGLKNSVVFLHKPPKGAPAKSDKITIDQVGCMYTPHVVALQTGQPLAVTSSDGTSHNVNGRPVKSAGFNFVQDKGDVKEMSFAKNETFSIKCDIHSWMQAWIAVFDHPYFAITDQDGNFEITGIPAGEYEVRAWHEYYGNAFVKTKVLKQKGVKVEAKTATELTFTFKSKK